MDIPPLTETVSAIKRDIPTQMVLIARDADRIIGTASGIVTEIVSHICTIRVVCVESVFHGSGIVAALLRVVEEAHPETRRFELTINMLVPDNVAFYERRGY